MQTPSRRPPAIPRRGGLLGIPTETVYGLGAQRPRRALAVRRIFKAKGRPRGQSPDHPCAGCLVAGSGTAADVPDDGLRAGPERFLAGPPTMILPPAGERTRLQTTGGLDTVGGALPATTR